MDEFLVSLRKLIDGSCFFGAVDVKSPPSGFLSSGADISFFVFFKSGSLKRLSVPELAFLAEALKSPGCFLSSDSFVYFLSFPKAGDSRSISEAGFPNRPALLDGFAGAAPNSDGLDSLFAWSVLFLDMFKCDVLLIVDFERIVTSSMSFAAPISYTLLFSAAASVVWFFFIIAFSTRPISLLAALGFLFERSKPAGDEIRSTVGDLLRLSAIAEKSLPDITAPLLLDFSFILERLFFDISLADLERPRSDLDL